jgi:hypothetical protein
VPGPAWAAAEIQRMLTMQAAENRVRSRTPISRRSLGIFPAAREGGLDVICEMSAPFSDLIPDPRRDYTLSLAGAHPLCTDVHYYA